MTQELLQQSGNDAAWTGLKRHILALFEAERAVSVARRAGAPARDFLPALEAKSALPSTTLLQVALLSAPASQQPVTAAHRAASLGRLFWRLDDLIDLLADHRQRVPNALLLRLRDRLDAQGRTGASDADLYDVAEETAAELIGLLDDLAVGASADVVDGINPVLDRTARFASETIAGWARWHDDAGSSPMVASGDHRDERHAVRQATAMLLGEQRNGYHEAVHHLGFPRQRGGRLAHEIHPALLFQRAVVLDGLLDARAAGAAVPDRVTSAEVMTILRLKHRDVRGGWSYIPEVPELPPDADDLGQVLQVLTRHGGPALAFACEEPIRLALDGAVPDGGFSTWILDSPRRSDADRQTRDYLNVVGGAGIHPDVVANLVQGLLAYDGVRYRDVMLHAVAYLESAQDGGGAWPSHWYAGPYYGTYRVASVIAALAPNAAALGRARAFLRDGQRRDGGWGDAATDPLSTALGLLAATSAGIDADDGVVERSASCLMALQEADGGWPASPWIVFQTMDGVESYGSRTITTAFCLKALATRVVGRSQGITRVGEALSGARRSHVGAG